MQGSQRSNADPNRAWWALIAFRGLMGEPTPGRSLGSCGVSEIEGCVPTMIRNREEGAQGCHYGK